jgi:F-type H+-transporting ATPase subunit b
MEALGINPLLLVAQIVSFLILYWVFKKFLYGKIEQALNDRRESVQKTFKDREEIELRLANVEKELEGKRKDMQKLGTQIEDEAKKTAEETRRLIVAKAEAEGEKEITKAKEKIRRETELAKEQLRSEVKNMAKAIVEKVMNEKAGDEKWQQTELDRSKRRLGKITPEGK